MFASAGFGVFGAPANGIEKRGRNLGLTSLVSLLSTTRMGSFSEIVSGEATGEEAKGLSVRIGMVLVFDYD